MSTQRANSKPESRTAKPKAINPRVTKPKLPRPEFIDIHGVAAMLNCTVSDVLRRVEYNQIPKPLHPGDEDQWRIKEIKRWIEADMPNRFIWERYCRNRE